MKTNAVEVALHRALGRLRELLEQPAETENPLRTRASPEAMSDCLQRPRFASTVVHDSRSLDARAAAALLGFARPSSSAALTVGTSRRPGGGRRSHSRGSHCSS